MDSRKKKGVLNHFEFWKRTDKTKPRGPFFMWKKEKAEKPMADTASAAAQTAKDAAHASLPVITGVGIAMLGDKGGYLPLAPLGVPVTVGGIVIDTVKAPFCLAVATEEAIRAGIMKLASLVFEGSPTEREIDRIFSSFLIRMRDTAAILVALELESSDVLNEKLMSGDIEDLVGLTLLHTAYASRNYDAGLLLANNKSLEREDCPPEGLMLFDTIMALKNSIRAALNVANKNDHAIGSDERELEESRIVCQWITTIKAGKTLSLNDVPEVSVDQIAVVNSIICQIENLKKLGMTLLPKPAEEVARAVPRL